MKTFFGVHTKKGLHDLCGRKFVGKVAKSHKNVSGKFGKFRSKILSIPKNLPAPTPMV